MKATTITNALVLEGWDGVPRLGAVRIEGDRIAAIAYGDDASALAARGGEIFDARGAVAMPGLVNAHHHSYANLLRGTENAYPLELWALFTVAYGRAFDAGTVRLAILIGAAEMLRAGVTAVIDHSPRIDFHEAAFAAHVESGMRVGFAPMFNDLHDHDILGLQLPPDLRAKLTGPAFAPAERIAAMFRGLASAARGHDRVSILLGPNAPQRCTDALLDLWRSLRDSLGLGGHTHLLETRAQAIASRRRWPHGMVRELDRRGLLDSRLGVAHGIWLDAADREVIARRGVTVVHNPSSNLMLGSGAIALTDYLARGASVALGSDSANTGGSADPFELMRMAMMLARLGEFDWRRWPGAADMLRMASEGGAKALGAGESLGRLEPGRLADLTILRRDGAAAITASDGRASLVQHATTAQIVATLVAGQFAFRDGRILAFDEPAVLSAFQARTAALLEAARDDLVTARTALDVIGPQVDRLRQGAD